MLLDKNDREWDRDCLERLDDLVTVCLADGQCHDAEAIRRLIDEAFSVPAVGASVMPSSADPTNGCVGIAKTLRRRLKKQGRLEKMEGAGLQCYRVPQVPDHIREKLERVRARETEDRGQVLALLGDGKGHEPHKVLDLLTRGTGADRATEEDFASAHRVIAALKREGVVISRVAREAGSGHEYEELWLATAPEDQGPRESIQVPSGDHQPAKETAAPRQPQTGEAPGTGNRSPASADPEAPAGTGRAGGGGVSDTEGPYNRSSEGAGVSIKEGGTGGTPASAGQGVAGGGAAAGQEGSAPYLVEEVEFHPAAELFPPPSPEERASLKNDIESKGQLVPIPLCGGKAPDGRTRYSINRELGRKSLVQEVPSGGSPVSLTLSLNLERRHLTSSQQAAVAVDAASLLAEEAAARERSGKSADGKAGGRGRKKNPPQKVGEGLAPTDKHAGEAAEQAARLTGTNRTYVAQAQKIKEQAPDLFEQVRKGEKSLRQAEKELPAGRGREENSPREAPATANKVEFGSWEIRCGDRLAEVASAPAGSAQLLIAAPSTLSEGGLIRWPVDEYELLSSAPFLDACARVITPEGSLWIFADDEHVAELHARYPQRGWHCRAWIKIRGRNRLSRPHNFDRCSSHLLYCVRDAEKFLFDEEALKGGSLAVTEDVWDLRRVKETARADAAAPDQLPSELIRPIVLCATRPEDLVLDPFGGAVTALAAVENGRHFLGVEADGEAAERLRERLRGLTTLSPAGSGPTSPPSDDPVVTSGDG